MSYTPLPPDLEHSVRIAAAFYDQSPSRFILNTVQKAISDLATHNSVLRAAFEHRP